ncbi:Y-family DNA polymerase [Anaerofustis butyriciformans]|uniref:Y-family DNA polymerase n=1 Tax=Anaerofustis butyriciformans TaxID=3108533 RepID=UPI003F8A946B
MKSNRIYMCIDLKSFYASVECRQRGLDPMTTNLVVADPKRSQKTICLAVSPAMKKLGVPGRCRLFEIPKHINYIIAPPQMKLYIDVSADIYGIYLKYISKDDIHVYSIDEVFMDVSDYLYMYKMNAKELAKEIMKDIYDTTGISSACGIGSNLYLAKVALDIMAKRTDDNIGVLNEKMYRRMLWEYRPITDFWRVGKGIANRLEKIGVKTMKDLAKTDENMLYKIFGIDAELLIDHAWGRESVTMQDIKKYKPKATSVGNGQVLGKDCDVKTGKIIVMEMVDSLCLDLTRKNLVCSCITLNVRYNKKYFKKYSHGTITIPTLTNSSKTISSYVSKLYDKIVLKDALIHRFYITFNNVTNNDIYQYNLFSNIEENKKEEVLQKTIINIKDKYGKNSLLKGMSLKEGATARERNMQIGGHRSGESK